MSIIGQRIKELRTTYNLSQKDLGDMLRLDRTTISHYEIGRRTPPIYTLMAIAEIFGVNVDSLVGESINEKPLELLVKDGVDLDKLPDECVLFAQKQTRLNSVELILLGTLNSKNININTLNVLIPHSTSKVIFYSNPVIILDSNYKLTILTESDKLVRWRRFHSKI